MKYKIAITGANGFLGTHLIERALRKKCEVVAVVRNRASLTFLRNFERLTIIESDYSTHESLLTQLSPLGPFDLFIHNAGLAKSFKEQDFITTNVGLTEKIIRLCQSSSILKSSGSCVYISSMAARGPSNKSGYVSAYGKSKFLAEQALIKSGLPYFIFRPTAIYGPRDLQFLPIFKLAKWNLYPAMTNPRQKITMIHAVDVAENILRITEKTEPNKIVHLTDLQVYSPQYLKNTVSKIMDKTLYNIYISKNIVSILLSVSDYLSKITKSKPGITLEQYSEISQDWDHDLTEERKTLPLQVEYSLMVGFRDTYNYFKREKLI